MIIRKWHDPDDITGILILSCLLFIDQSGQTARAIVIQGELQVSFLP